MGIEKGKLNENSCFCLRKNIDVGDTYEFFFKYTHHCQLMTREDSAQDGSWPHLRGPELGQAPK